MATIFETIIVGGGVAGLTVAESLAKKGNQVTLLERYPNFGGRIVTYRTPPLQYEIGAGRISLKHNRVLSLIKRFKMHTYPISSDSYFEGTENKFNALFAPIREYLKSLDSRLLSKHTIGELVPKELLPLLKMYPYTAELHLLRADCALPSFEPMETMGADAKFIGVAEGLDTITTRLAESATHSGADLRTRHRVHDVKRLHDGSFEISGDFGKKAEAKPFTYHAKRIIIATCRCSLTDFSVLRGLPLLKQLATSALLRIYAVYPKNPTTGKVWFQDLPKTITANPLRYIIPIEPKKGLIMISYTDGDDTSPWKDLDDAQLHRKIAQNLKLVFPTLTIPAPTYLQKHYWPSGCTYWLPGNYSIEKAVKEAQNPGPNLYICGESISMQQAWIEGALESAERLLTIL